MKDEYVEEIEYQICVETIRCAKIRDILFFSLHLNNYCISLSCFETTIQKGGFPISP